MTEQFSNFAQTTLASAVTANQTTITLSASANFPASYPYRIAVTDGVNNEIMLATGPAGGSAVDVTRRYEGASSFAFAAGSVVANVATAGIVSQLWNNFINVNNYGAQSLNGDMQPIFSAALAAMPLGRDVYFNAGQYYFDETLSNTGPINLIGEGSGTGPGIVSNGSCSQILANFASGDIIHVGPTLYGSRFENFQINSNGGQRTGGAGIYLGAGGLISTQNGNRINNVSTNNMYVAIELLDCYQNVIENSYHEAWALAAIYSHSDGVHEADGGAIVKNHFFGDTNAGTPQEFNVRVDHGYTRIAQNLILGSQFGVWNYTYAIGSGAFEVINNWIEEQDVAGVYLAQASTGQISVMAAVNWNEFSVATYAASTRANYQAAIAFAQGAASWLSCFQAIGNRIRNSVAPTNPPNMIAVFTGSQGQINSNNLVGLAGNTGYGINVGSQASQIDILDNLVTGSFGGGNPYNLTGACNFRDFGSNLTVAQLNAAGVPRNGSSCWAADGCPGSNPLQGGGVGCVAWVEGGVWKGKPPRSAATLTSSTAYTVVDTDTDLVLSGTGAITLTLPNAAHYVGREINLRQVSGEAVASAASNVVPLAGGSPGTTLLGNTPGKWCRLLSDATNWQVMAAN